MRRIVDEPGLRGLLAPNPGPMTLDGTNTWVIGIRPGDAAAAPPIVVDPGPADQGHLDDVWHAAGGRIGVILITHRHADHTEGVRALAARADGPVRAVDPAHRLGFADPTAGGLADGDLIEAGSARLEVVATPGHTDDSVSFLLTGAGRPRLLTGDTVLGRGTSVIAAPDGDLGAYLESLQRLIAVVTDREVHEILPGHGPVIERPLEVLQGYLAHRRERLQQVRAAVRAGAVTAADVVERVYGDVDRRLWPAATQSVEAQLRYLDARN